MDKMINLVVATIEDYPAAHSMDVNWFAVDSDGHIAVWNSNAEGAVPAHVVQRDQDKVTDDIYDYLDDRMNLVPDLSEFLETPSEDFEAFPFLYPNNSILTKWTTRIFNTSISPAILLIRNDYKLEIWEAKPTAVYNFLPGRVALFDINSKLPYKCYRKLIKDRALLKVWQYDYSTISKEHLGLYSYNWDYDEAEESNEASLYKRDSAPSKPLHISQLPPAVQAKVESVKMDTSFAANPEINLKDHYNELWEYGTGRGVTEDNKQK